MTNNKPPAVGSQTYFLVMMCPQFINTSYTKSSRSGQEIYPECYWNDGKGLCMYERYVYKGFAYDCPLRQIRKLRHLV